MIHVPFVVRDDDEWSKWCARCDQARVDLVAAVRRGEAPKISTALYKAQKGKLLEIFHNKCAFCETPIRPGMHGDVEHFRPKGGVVDDDGNPVRRTTSSGSIEDHPGYYWLAYEWQNLLIACQLCNQPSAGGAGKRNYFPLRKRADGQAVPRAWEFGEESAEDPLFIHPSWRDPSVHLEFDATGAIIPRSEDGQACVDRMDLNRDELITARQGAYNTARDKFNAYMGKAREDTTTVNRLEGELTAWLNGLREYAAAAREAIRFERATASERLAKIGG